MGFPEQLKRARLAAGLTQQQVADAVGITNSTYCGYETGKRQPDVARIKQLAKALRTSGDALLETGYAADGDPELEEAAAILRTLRPAYRDFALEQLRRLQALQEQ